MNTFNTLMIVFCKLKKGIVPLALQLYIDLVDYDLFYIFNTLLRHLSSTFLLPLHGISIILFCVLIMYYTFIKNALKPCVPRKKM